VRARADAGILTVFAELTRLIRAAFRVSWQANRIRTAVVVVATVCAGAMATFGLLATQQVLVGLFTASPTPGRVKAALPALLALAVITVIRAALGYYWFRLQRLDPTRRQAGPTHPLRDHDYGSAGIIRPRRLCR
jgi:ATP-binding cassette, subfamily B, bacterial